MKRVVFACGGTLGHINPALAVARKLAKYGGYEIYFISTKKEYHNQVYNDDFIKEVYYFDLYGLSRKKILKNVKYMYKNICSYHEIKKLLLTIKADVVISMGGSCGTLSVLAAHQLNIKTIIHEQNRILGLGNQKVLKKCDKVLLSYPIENIDGVVVGNPVECEYYENNLMNMKSGDEILIFGGSNGAQFMNDFFIDHYKSFDRYKIILFTGDKYYRENKEKIERTNHTHFLIYSKTNEMIAYYNRAKVVIARGGATTIAEIMALGKVSIIIPSPNVTKNHQYHNALYYQELGCLELIEEDKLDVNKFTALLEKATNHDFQKKMKQKISIKHNIYSSYLFIDELKKVIGEVVNE